jgi:electron transport complex protein RnfG
MALRLVATVICLTAALAGPALAGGKTFLTKEEALALAFEGCKVERTVKVLDSQTRKRVEKLSGSDLERAIAYAYTATKEGKCVGTAYFDVHRVRTMRQVLMVVVDPAGKVRRVELLAFAEPAQFIPNSRWYGQFVGKALDETLSLKRDIKGVTGATLTARATTQAVRRVLAIHAVLNPAPPEKAPTKKQPRPLPGAKPDGTP